MSIVSRKPDMNSSTKDAKIRWRCHRGMLELDLILLPFFDQHFHSLGAAQQQQFEDLLEATDPELFQWLLGHVPCEDPHLGPMVKQIRAILTRGD